MKKVNYIIFAALFISVVVLANSQFKLNRKQEVENAAEKYRVDHLGNVYMIKGNVLKKYIDIDKEEPVEYSNNEYGHISFVDVSNPLRILVFYKDFNTLVFLDKSLSVIGDPVQLDELGHLNTGLVCASNNGGFWLYDNRNEQLFYYNSNLENIHKSISINSISNGEKKPVYLIEKNNFIYLNIPDYGILLFNHLGKYKQMIPLINIHEFQVMNEDILYFSKENKSLIKFDINEHLTESILLPDTNNVMNAALENRKLFVLKKKSFSVYDINEESGNE
jgi:hypothetical protein